MFYEESTRRQPEAAIVIPLQHRRWTSAEMAAIFGRRVIDGMLEGRSPAWIYEQARLAGSYGRMALDEQQRVETAHAAEVRRGFAVVRAAFGDGGAA